MKESNELINYCLETAGEPLEFDSVIIQGIPGFDLSVLYKGETTVYEIERQNFSFMVSTVEVESNEIKKGDFFELIDNTFRYKFQLDRPPISDLMGYSELKVNFISKELI